MALNRHGAWGERRVSLADVGRFLVRISGPSQVVPRGKPSDAALS